MGDKYMDIINSPFGKQLSSRLGLPAPAVLRRFKAGDPIIPGPALLGVAGGSGLAGLDKVLTDADIQVETVDSDEAKYGALIFDATSVKSPSDLADLRAFFNGPLRRLMSGGRVVIIGQVPDGQSAAADAARHGLVGVVRSLAKELRGGSTANILQVDADATGATVESALRFFLSGKSAYVDGQPLLVSSKGAAPAPADWDKPLAGKVALVTGAARGIGAAIAETLSRDGATVICADLPAAGESLAKVANKIGGTTLQLDISAPDAAATILEYANSRHGGLDIVVHNAGITRDKLLANMKPEVWDAVINVNIESQLRINETLLAKGGLRKGGRVVGLASTSGIAGNRGQTNYAASKAGVIAMTAALAPKFAESDATINAIAPGFIDTDMTHAIPFATREVARRLNAVQQAGLPIDVAEAITWLCSSGAGGVNGQTLRVCGQNLVGA